MSPPALVNQIDPDLAPLVLIPARGGSKGVPGKNLRPVGGIPLLARCIRAARAAKSVGAIWVSSDDACIGQLGEEEGARWLQRPSELSGDQASSELALLHALTELAERGPLPALFVFLQCTSPFTTGPQIDAVVNALQLSQANMAFSVMPWHGFLWCLDGNGHGVGINHNSNEPRRRRCSRATRWQWRSLGALYRQCYCDYTAMWLQEWYVATLGHRWVPSTSRGDAPDRAQLSS